MSLIQLVENKFFELGMEQLRSWYVGHPTEHPRTWLFGTIFCFIFMLFIEHVVFISDLKSDEPIINGGGGLVIWLAFIFFAISLRMIFGYSILIYQNIISAMIFFACYMLISISLFALTGMRLWRAKKGGQK
jgi:hypothetical protein